MKICIEIERDIEMPIEREEEANRCHDDWYREKTVKKAIA